MPSQPFIVAIAGPSCSGKTALTRGLAAALQPESVAVIDLDAYYRDLAHLSPEERTTNNFDEPEALDWPLFIRQMSALARGIAVEIPVYNFASHTRLPATRPVSPGDYLIVEGLFALHAPQIRSLSGLRVFVELDDEVCLARRLKRDTQERGRSRESIVLQYTQVVRPMASLHVLPTRSYADLIIDGTASIADSVGQILTRLRSARR